METEDERVSLAVWRGEVVDPSIIAERGWDGYIAKAPNIIGEKDGIYVDGDGIIIGVLLMRFSMGSTLWCSRGSFEG